MQSTRKRNHRLGNVHSGDRRAALGCHGGHVTRPGGDIEHPVASANVRGVEQRIDEPSGNRTEEVLVPGGLLLPARRLEALNASASTGYLGHSRRSYELPARVAMEGGDRVAPPSAPGRSGSTRARASRPCDPPERRLEGSETTA